MNRTDRAQLAFGFIALLLGTLVYALDRPTEQNLVTSTIDFAPHAASVFGVLGGNLPAFLHVFAFSLFTIALLGQSKSTCIGACYTWALINTAFELGQHAMVADWLCAHLDGNTLFTPINNYFRHGTFDPWDLLAILMGALAAYLVATQAKPQQPCHD